MPRKKRVFVVHWKAVELDERIVRIQILGYAVDAESGEGGVAARSIKKQEPDAIVIDLSRLPSHGRHLAIWLREQKTTRHIPLVFVDGDVTKLVRLKRDLPDAVYTTWSGIKGALARAIAKPPKDPVVPRRPDYSGTPLPKKLGIKDDSVLALLAAPKGFEKTLGELPARVRIKTQARCKADVIVLFTKTAADLRKRFAGAHRALCTGGALWVAWPKKNSSVNSDLDKGVVMTIGLASGLVDNKICAIDSTWSGLRFMRRRN